MHNGRFDVRNGRALRAPACIDLRSYKTKIEEGKIWIELD